MRVSIMLLGSGFTNRCIVIFGDLASASGFRMDAAPSLASPTSSRNSGHSPAPVESSAEPNQSAANLTAVVNDYNSLLEAIRARIRSLDTTNSAIEEMSGLPRARSYGEFFGGFANVALAEGEAPLRTTPLASRSR